MRCLRPVVTTVAVLGCLALAAPAVAYVNDVTVNDETASFLATDQGGSHATACMTPTGARIAIGGGARITPDIPDLALYRIDPAFDSDFFVGGATAVDPISSPWSLRVWTFCAVLDAVQPNSLAAAGYVKRVQIIHTQSPYDSSTYKSVSATCPAGKVLIGGGGGDVDAPDDVAFDRVGPGNNENWVVRAHETDSTPNNWQVESKAICADTRTNNDAGSHYVDNVVFVAASSTFDSQGIKKAIAKCPEGKHIIGGGGRILSEGGARDVALSRSQPRSDESTDTRWAAEGTETDPTGDDWSVQAIAVCADIHASPSISD